MTKQEIVDEQFEEIVVVDITIANSDDTKQVQKDNEVLDEIFLKPERIPNEAEKRNMLVKSVEIMCIASLESNVYKFGTLFVMFLNIE